MENNQQLKQINNELNFSSNGRSINQLGPVKPIIIPNKTNIHPISPTNNPLFEENIIPIEFINTQIDRIYYMLNDIDRLYESYHKRTIKAKINSVRKLFNLLKEYIEYHKINVNNSINGQLINIEQYINYLIARVSFNENNKQGGKSIKKKRKHKKKLLTKKKRAKKKIH